MSIWNKYVISWTATVRWNINPSVGDSYTGSPHDSWRPIWTYLTTEYPVISMAIYRMGTVISWRISISRLAILDSVATHECHSQILRLIIERFFPAKYLRFSNHTYAKLNPLANPHVTPPFFTFLRNIDLALTANSLESVFFQLFFGKTPEFQVFFLTRHSLPDASTLFTPQLNRSAPEYRIGTLQPKRGVTVWYLTTYSVWIFHFTLEWSFFQETKVVAADVRQSYQLRGL